MVSKICRICLHTNIPLQEMNKEHLDYFLEICSCKKKHSKHLLCHPCLVNLADNLKFRKKCVKANKILQKWKKKKSLIKQPLNTLHTLLIKNDETLNGGNKKNHRIIKECFSKNAEDKLDIIDVKTEDNIIQVNTDVENIEELKDFEDTVEERSFVDCSEFEYEDETNTELPNNCNVNEITVKPKKIKKDPDRSQKVCREYDQYIEVFEIVLFNTIDDARAELLSRATSEPYLTAQFRCDLCYTTFKSDKLQLFHKKWHNESSPLECPVCCFRFLTSKSLRNHRTKCHRGKFSCKMCPLVTYHESVMKRHFEKHQGKTFKCDCGRAFKHKSTYLNHRRNVHGSSHVCVTCARTFVSRLGLLNHRSRAHQVKATETTGEGVDCSQCELTFPNRYIYTVHVLSTHKDTQEARDMIACRFCGLTFDDVEQLKVHKKQSHLPGSFDNGPVKCQLCGVEGAGPAWRPQHYRAEHPHARCQTASEAAAQHMCDQCGRLFSSVYVLRDHLNLHLGLRPWACRARACAAAFRSRSARAQHEARHAPAATAPTAPATRRSRQTGARACLLRPRARALDAQDTRH